MPKSDINAEIQTRIESFAEELTELVRQSALEAVQEALHGGTAGAPRRRPGRPAGRKKAGVKRGRARGGKRVRRSEEQLASLAGKVLGYVQKNPGSRLEEISAGLGIQSAELKRPVANLLEEKALKKAGQRRGTKYSVGRKAK